MKYRVRDPKKREAIKTLFNHEEFELIQRFPCSAKVWFMIVDEELNTTAFEDDIDLDLEPVGRDERRSNNS